MCIRSVVRGVLVSSAVVSPLLTVLVMTPSARVAQETSAVAHTIHMVAERDIPGNRSCSFRASHSSCRSRGVEQWVSGERLECSDDQTHAHRTACPQNRDTEPDDKQLHEIQGATKPAISSRTCTSVRGVVKRSQRSGWSCRIGLGRFTTEMDVRSAV